MTAPIAVVFDSGHGHTAKLAEAIGLGLTERGAVYRPVALADGPYDLDLITSSAGIIFGAPTYMGGVSARFKGFMDDSSDVWMDQPWRDKIAGGFTIGSRQSGDKLATLQHLAIFAAQHGMVWVGQDIIGPAPSGDGARDVNGDGSWLGLMSTSDRDKAQLVPEGDLKTARAFGARIATAVARWGT